MRRCSQRLDMVGSGDGRYERGSTPRAERDVTLSDISPDDDRSQVRVWYRDDDGRGGSHYPVYGFV
ncbi:hypothetical protein [Sphingomonas sp.]